MNTDYDRIESAIRFIEDHAEQQPSLDDVADHVGLSSFHFQRLFQRWAGVSPKRFLQYLTVEQAKELLRDAHSVLDTTFETGLSSPSRLHDLFVATDAVTPGEYKRLGADLEIAYGFHSTPFGECLLATTERGICQLSFVADESEGIEELEREWPHATLSRDRAMTEGLARDAFRHLEGTPAAPPRLMLRGTNFQIKVWHALLRTSPGSATSYSALAAAIGQPRAAQAVGQAVGANRIAMLIPCHRVLRRSGSCGDYRWGAHRKRAILGWEAARHDLATAVGG